MLTNTIAVVRNRAARTRQYSRSVRPSRAVNGATWDRQPFRVPESICTSEDHSPRHWILLGVGVERVQTDVPIAGGRLRSKRDASIVQHTRAGDIGSGGTSRYRHRDVRWDGLLFLSWRSSTIVAAAIAEDVDVIGLSILSGSHKTLVAEILDLLSLEKASDIPVIVGGIIPEDDAQWLESIGVAATFTPKDFNTTQIMNSIVEILNE